MNGSAEVRRVMQWKGEQTGPTGAARTGTHLVRDGEESPECRAAFTL